MKSSEDSEQLPSLPSSSTFNLEELRHEAQNLIIDKEVDSEDENYDDWIEEDDDEELLFKSLFDNDYLPTVKDLIKHDLEVYDFDLKYYALTFCYNDTDMIMMINYIRQRIQFFHDQNNEEKKERLLLFIKNELLNELSKRQFHNDLYMIPTLKNDSLLFSYEDGEISFHDDDDDDDEVVIMDEIIKQNVHLETTKIPSTLYNETDLKPENNKKPIKVLVTGSSGHLGEGIIRTMESLPEEYDVIGIDIKEGLKTTYVGDITNRSFLQECLINIQVIIHTATLHKPHIHTHTNQDFIDINIKGTLNLLEVAIEIGIIETFIFTSSTTVYGDSLIPPINEPTAWITEDTKCIPKNIYGVTKRTAEDLCQLFHRNYHLNCLILRTSRFFPEEDDDPLINRKYSLENHKMNEYLYRRVELSDVIHAHILAIQKAKSIKFDTFIISATIPFTPLDLPMLRINVSKVLNKYYPKYSIIYERLGWLINDTIDRVYVNTKAQQILGWNPLYNFHSILQQLDDGHDPKEVIQSNLTKIIGCKGYH